MAIGSHFPTKEQHMKKKTLQTLSPKQTAAVKGGWNGGGGGGGGGF